jgi:hypothetical protein
MTVPSQDDIHPVNDVVVNGVASEFGKKLPDMPV